MTDVAEMIVARPARPRREDGVGGGRRRAESRHRRHPPAGGHGVDRGAPRGDRGVRGRRPGAADRDPRRLHGHGRPRLDPPAQRALRREEVPTRRCWRSAARSRSRRSAATSSRRSTTTRCSRTSPSSTRRSRARRRCPGCSSGPSPARSRSRGVAILTLPGDVGALEVPSDAPEPHFVSAPACVAPDASTIAQAAAAIDAAGSVAMLVGLGAREAREGVLALADRLAAPMILSLKAKEGLEADNPFEVGQNGLIGNPAAYAALADAELLLLVGTDFPYRDWLPTGKAVVQIDRRGAHIGRRIAVTHPDRRRRGPRGRRAARPGCGQAGPVVPRGVAREVRGLEEAAAAAGRTGLRRHRDREGPQPARQPGGADPTPRHSPRRSTATPRRTRSSPPTPACRRSGSLAS